jgi:hypothetical protein
MIQTFMKISGSPMADTLRWISSLGRLLLVKHLSFTGTSIMEKLTMTNTFESNDLFANDKFDRRCSQNERFGKENID